MKQLDEYLKLKQEIFDYFGYVEDYKIIPIEDSRDMYWTLYQDKYGNGQVSFGPTKEEVGLYVNEIYTQRFLPKWVYRAKDYTMICVDTHCDGNKFLQIFDNSKEVKDE